MLQFYGSFYWFVYVEDFFSKEILGFKEILE